jgi:CopG family transcriptional regulator, nickel-responsive regulator
MGIVSLSLPSKMVQAMDEIQESVGFSGRSELVRAAIRLMLEETRQRDALRGQVSAILVVTHDKNDEDSATKVKHKFEDVVRTHVHSKVTADDCVEVFLVQGEGREIASMSKAFQREKGIREVRLVTI